MPHGLPEKTLAQIIACLKTFPSIRWVKIYGSRAKGTYRPGSDIDLAFSSTKNISARLLGMLDELPTPYLFDVTHYESLQSEALKEHIDRVGKIIFENDV